MARNLPRRARVATLGRSAASLLAVVGVVLLRGCDASPGGERPANVLLLVVDTLRSNRLSCYGYSSPTSPNIDRLAQRGTLYRRNYSQACWTLPSMISIMSGRSIVDEIKVLPANVPVLAETLREGGFETAGFVANAVLGSASGFSRGFDDYVALDNVSAQDLADRFARWHEARQGRVAAGGSGKPFFAWVQFIDPHHPYRPDPVHDVFRGPRADQDILTRRWNASSGRLAELSPDPSTPPLSASIEKAKEESNRYDGEVLAVDDGVGRILAQLERAGELANTLVILASDHGEMLYEHPQEPLIVQKLIADGRGLRNGVLDLFGRGHRPWYYEDLWNTPLILAGPGMPAGVSRTGLSANLDISATILDAVGLAPRPDQEGRSLWGGRDPGRAMVFAYGHHTSAVIASSGKKLIRHSPTLFLRPKTAEGPLQMHDLRTDPLEENEIGDAQAGERDRLAGEIEAWRSRSPRFDPAKANEEQLQTLKRLGYTDDGH